MGAGKQTRESLVIDSHYKHMGEEWMEVKKMKKQYRN